MRSGFSISLIVTMLFLLVAFACGQPSARQFGPTPTPDIRATIVAEITATAAAAHALSPTPTAASQLRVLPGSFVSPIPNNLPVLTNTPHPTSTPRPTPTPLPTFTPRPTSMPTPIETPTLSSVVEDISPSVVQIVTPLGTGSGFVMDAGGLVLTNAHVVSDLSTVKVRFSSGVSRTGKVLGVDEVADLALIEVTTYQRLHPMPLGDSDAVKVGEEVITMGFPAVDTLGSTPTITRGIISAKRSLDSGIALLQTDAAINPGNSGGPLFRRDGQVVGVNTSKIFKSDDGRPLEGIGMAVSINDVRDRLDSLSMGESVLLDTPVSFGTLELASALDGLLPASFEELDPASEDLSITDLGLEDYFTDLVVYASAEPFQLIMATAGGLSGLERISLEYELSDIEAFLDEARKSALWEVQVTDPDANIDDYGLLNMRQIGEVSAAIWMDFVFDGINLRSELIMFLRGNHVGMVWLYYFQGTGRSVSLDDVAGAIDEAMTERAD